MRIFAAAFALLLLANCAADYKPALVLCLFARCEVPHDPPDERRGRSAGAREPADHFD